jgi:UDP-glucose 4-epimerase
MKVLITGAAGFIGSHMMQSFRDAGYEVAGIDLAAKEGVLNVDITDYQSLERTMVRERPEAVVHLAAISGTTGKNEIEQSLRQPHLNFKVNAYGTANVCEACRTAGVNRLVYMSTFAVYGKLEKERLPITERTPTSAHHAYAVSKLMGEDIVRTYSEDFGLKSVIFRAPFIAGEHQKERNVLREFVEAAIADRELVIFGDGGHVREFIHTSDLAKAFVRAVEFTEKMELDSDLFVLGNEPVSISKLAELVIKRVGRGRIKHIGNSDRSFDQYSDFSKARQLLGWSPELGVEQIINRILSSEYSYPRL